MDFSAYGDKLLDHALNPRNVGDIADADGVATVGDPSCGDVLKVWIRVKDDRARISARAPCTRPLWTIPIGASREVN